jgi:hypothetical protein
VIPEYAYDEAAQIAEDGQRLTKARENIPLIKAELKRLQEILDGAERLVAGLTVSLPLRQRALELLCADQGWDFPAEAPGEQPIEHKAMAATTRTKSFPVVQVAKPMQDGAPGCDWADCGQELIYENDVWLHASTGRVECHPEPAAPALQVGTDGDPTKRTVLPPHIAEEVRTDGQ